VPFEHSSFLNAKDADQGWHKDGNGIYNARKFRHHRPVQAEVFLAKWAVDSFSAILHRHVLTHSYDRISLMNFSLRTFRLRPALNDATAHG
jgi:hypothetical protein